MKQHVVNKARRASLNQMIRQNKSLLALVLLGFIGSLAGCKKTTDDVTPQTTTTSSSENSTVNNWILDNMRQVYYWNDKIPANPDTTLTPDVFFDSILNKYNATTNPEGDRFSWIENDANTLAAELRGESVTTGMDYNLYLRGSTGVIAQVLYVLPGSPAEKAGLKRGDIITKVNGQLLNTSNYEDLLFTGTTFTYGLGTVSGTSIVDTDQTRSVTATVYQENPVFLDSIYTVGAKKVGYLVYNQFVPGANGSTADEYDAQVDAIFSKFKAQGVSELILDLRYNPGGYTSSSANLASLIGKGVNSSKLYFREEWNSTITPYLKKEWGANFNIQNFLDKPQNIGTNLSRVFVLTTDQTASASELIINGLRPYMTVTTIGTTTHGKNVGSITLTDETGKIKWGMQPIVFKSYNSLGQSDYAAGFTPNIEVDETTPLLPLGDSNENLLNEALNQIAGNASSGRRAAVRSPLIQMGSSIQRKAGGQSMIREIKDLQL